MSQITRSRFGSGIGGKTKIAWHGGNSGGETHPVGQLQANRLGFHDMLGNVYEWVEGCPDFYPSTPCVDPIDRECTSTPPWFFAILRGGSWYAPPLWNGTQAQSSFRTETPCCAPASGPFGPGLGFRVARNP